VASKATPPSDPPSNSKSSISKDMSHELHHLRLRQNAENSGWNSPNRGVSCRNGPAAGHLDGGGVRGGLIRFYREIAGIGLVFPRADRPIAVEYPGYPVITLRPIGGLEFVLEAVAAVGSSG
jgi:hypothetical protein